MRLDLDIPKTELVLLEQEALASGKDVSDVVLDAVREKFGNSGQADPELSEDEWRSRLVAFAKRHEPTGFPLDDSRESIYADRT